MTAEQVAVLLTQPDANPSLSLILRRQREGHPMSDITVRDVRAGIAELKAAIRCAEVAMGESAAPAVPAQSTRKEVPS